MITGYFVTMLITLVGSYIGVLGHSSDYRYRVKNLGYTNHYRFGHMNHVAITQDDVDHSRKMVKRCLVVMLLSPIWPVLLLFPVFYVLRLFVGSIRDGFNIALDKEKV